MMLIPLSNATKVGSLKMFALSDQECRLFQLDLPKWEFVGLGLYKVVVTFPFSIQMIMSRNTTKIREI